MVHNLPVGNETVVFNFALKLVYYLTSVMSFIKPYIISVMLFIMLYILSIFA